MFPLDLMDFFFFNFAEFILGKLLHCVQMSVCIYSSTFKPKKEISYFYIYWISEIVLSFFCVCENGSFGGG